MYKKIIVFICLLGLCGCNKDEQTYVNNDFPKEYSLMYDNLVIYPGDIFDKEMFGEPLEYSEIPSCAFDGLNKTFRFEHYEITTHEDGNKDIIESIYFLDLFIKTSEGVGIGDSLSDMIDKYGDSYVVNGIEYIYEIDGVSLIFLVENNIITSVEYKYNG